MTDLATLLAGAPLFADVDAAALNRIAQLTDEVHIAGPAIPVDVESVRSCFLIERTIEPRAFDSVPGDLPGLRA